MLHLNQILKSKNTRKKNERVDLIFSNKRLDEMFKAAFRSWSIEKGFNSEAKDKYPMLIGISRDRNGNFVFDRLIEGARTHYNLDEFIKIMDDFKAKFENTEQALEQAKVGDFSN